MADTLTPEEPRTPVLSPDVNDLFDLAAPPVQQVVAQLVPVQSQRDAIPINVGDNTFVLGRGKELSVPYRIHDAPKLSSKHCNVRLDPATLAVFVTDTSTNGTYVNGQRLAKGEEAPLKDGDALALVKPAATVSPASGGAAPPSAVTNLEQVEYVLQRLRPETSVSKLVEELTCPVCRAIYLRPCSMLPCMHVVCASCVSQWLREGHKECVECRRPIEEVRPTHKLQSCVDQLLLAEPHRRRSEAETRALEAADDIPPGGKVILGVKRGRHGDGAYDDDWRRGGDSESSENSEGNSGGDDLPVPLHLMHNGMQFHLNGPNPQAPAGARCAQCVTASTVDGFQCPAGGPHLTCRACARPFPERPLCGRPQRCWLCSAPYCSQYYAREGGCPAQGTVRRFQPLEAYTFTALPPTTFGGNVTEQTILTNYMAAHAITAAAAWVTCLVKLRDGTWKPDLTSINGPLAATSPVCDRCADSAFAALLFHYRRAIPRDELPESVTKRSDCWYGHQCRTQFHKPQHAQNFNHVCYQEKRKE